MSGHLGPVKVSVDNQLVCGGTSEKKPMIDSIVKVPEDPLDSGEVRLPRIMHVKTNLLNNICDVGPSEGEVPKSTGKAPIGSGVTEMSSSPETLACASTMVTHDLHSSMLVCSKISRV